MSLIDRLRRTKAAPVTVFVNPDGPEAATQLEAMQAEIDRLAAENDRLAGWLYEACGGFKVSDEAMSLIGAMPQNMKQSGPFYSLDEFRQRIASLHSQGSAE